MVMGRSIEQILGLNPNIPEDWGEISTTYEATEIKYIKIDGDTFTNYGDFQFVWEKSYVREPTRSGDGTIGNLNSYATFITPHLIINFSVMSIDDYRSIMRKDLGKNEFLVECYDPIYNTTTVNKMYFAPQSLAKLYTINRMRLNGDAWEEFIELAGVHDYTVELIGTNSAVDTISVTYHLNPPAGLTNDRTEGEDDVYVGQEVVIGKSSTFQSETFGGRYNFIGWNISPQGGETGNYVDGTAYAITGNLVLYAKWQPTTEHTLLFNYGVAEPKIDSATMQPITKRTVVKGKSIGVLPTPDPSPSVTYEGAIIRPYHNAQWWKTATKVPTAEGVNLVVQNNQNYWSDRDESIFLLYDVYEYTVVHYIDGEKISETLVPYNEKLPLPTYVKDGYTFDGWYKTSDFKEGSRASGNMPPKRLNLYARWIKK